MYLALHLIFVCSIVLYFFKFHNLGFINCLDKDCFFGLKNAVVADSYNYFHTYYDFYYDFNFWQVIDESRVLKFFQGDYPMPNNNVILSSYMKMIKNNLIIFTIINLLIYSFLICNILNYLENYHKNIFIIILTLNIYIYGAFSLPNKEIFGYLGALGFIGYLISRRFYFLLIAMLISLISRIILFYYIILFTMFLFFWENILYEYIKKEFLRRYKFIKIENFKQIAFLVYSLVCMAISFIFISKVYNMVGGSEYILKGFNQNDNKSFNFLLHEMSMSGLSFLTIWIKILQNLFGGVISFESLLSTENYLNRYSEYLHLFLLIILFNKIIFNFKKIVLKYEILIIFFLYLFYLLVFSMQSFIMHRYVVSGFPFLILFATYVLASPKK